MPTDITVKIKPPSGNFVCAAMLNSVKMKLTPTSGLLIGTGTINEETDNSLSFFVAGDAFSKYEIAIYKNAATTPYKKHSDTLDKSGRDAGVFWL